jgi:hypothetical protein
MAGDITHGSGLPEIESFNLSDLDVSALDFRLELSTLIPQCTLIICTGNCSVNCVCYNVDGCHVHCSGNHTCNCNGLD